MALAEARSRTQTSSTQTSSTQTWHGIVLQTLKANSVKLVAYVPDKVFTPLIASLHGDSLLQDLLKANEASCDIISTG